MKLIKPSFEILKFDDNILIERAGRTCYKSEDKITNGSADKFAQMLFERNHTAMIEFGSAIVRVVCDRGISHEIVRHRIASYAQESTRFCNYGKANEVTFILPTWLKITEEDFYQGYFGIDDLADATWFQSIADAEKAYLSLLEKGWKPEQARSVLPNSLKTEIVIGMNFRSWQNFFRLRCSEKAHPQMREIAIPLQQEFAKRNPFLFGVN